MMTSVDSNGPCRINTWESIKDGIKIQANAVGHRGTGTPYAPRLCLEYFDFDTDYGKLEMAQMSLSPLSVNRGATVSAALVPLVQ